MGQFPTKDLKMSGRSPAKRFARSCAVGVTCWSIAAEDWDVPAIAARLLVELGMEPAEAIARVRAVRPGAIETPEQKRFVLERVAVKCDRVS